MNYEVSATPITKYKFRSIKTMKRYIKPNTEMHEIELQSMIADSPGLSKEETSAEGLESKYNNITPSSPSLWDEEEE